MKTATVRDLRNDFARVSRLLAGGQEVEITKRGQVMARLVPVKAAQVKRPDWAARRKAILGGRVLEGNSVLLMREGSEW